MKKVFLLIAMVILMTGCSNFSYDLNINLNSNEEVLTFNHNNINETTTLITENIESIPTLSNKEINYNITSSNAEIIYDFENISDLQHSEVIKMLYDNVNISVSNNVTTIKMTGYNNSRFVCGEFDEGCLIVLDKVVFNLNSEYQIVSSNADEVDEFNNKYTWVFTSKNRDEIYFSYSNEIRWDVVIKNFISKNSKILTILAILFVLTIIGIIFVFKFMKKMKENNS